MKFGATPDSLFSGDQVFQRLKEIPRHDVEWGIIQLAAWVIFLVALSHKRTPAILKRWTSHRRLPTTRT